MNQVRYVPLEEIIVTNSYLRLNTRIEELKKSIKAIGLIHPLIINHENELIAGGRRYSALKELGIEQVPVVVAEHNRLEQELISIDENLMRLPLKNIQMEQALNRGREIYEELYPSAKKVKTTADALERKPPQPTPEPAEYEDPDVDKVDGKASFVEVTAQKTGLSEGVIRSAIIRDERSSDMVKAARGHGELGASQTNELVKLDKEQQDQLLPHVKKMSVKDLRKVVKDAKTNGLDETIEVLLTKETIPKEYETFKSSSKKFAKLCSKIIAEELDCRGKEQEDIIESSMRLIESLRKIVEINSREEEPEEPEESEEASEEETPDETPQLQGQGTLAL